MTLDKIKTLVIEDEADVRRELIDAINETYQFEVVGSAGEISEAFGLIKKIKADLIFLDVKLIGGHAYQLLNNLKKSDIPIPPVVFTTGYREFEHAQKMHNDYGDVTLFILKKPFFSEWMEHQERIIDMLNQRKATQEDRSAQRNSEKITLTEGKKSYRVDLNDIIYFKVAEKGSSKIIAITESRNILCNMSLQQTSELLPDFFLFVNRFEIINFNKINYLDHSAKELVMSNGHVCSVGLGYYPYLNARMKG